MTYKIDKIDQCPFILEKFDQIQFAGAGDGIAVMRERALNYECASLNRSVEGGECILLKGDPLKEFKRYQLNQDDVNARLNMLSSTFKMDGCISGPPILDGDAYLVEWRTNNKLVRLFLCNPFETDDELLIKFARNVIEFITLAWKGAGLKFKK